MPDITSDLRLVLTAPSWVDVLSMEQGVTAGRTLHGKSFAQESCIPLSVLGTIIVIEEWSFAVGAGIGDDFGEIFMEFGVSSRRNSESGVEQPSLSVGEALEIDSDPVRSSAIVVPSILQGGGRSTVVTVLNVGEAA